MVMRMMKSSLSQARKRLVSFALMLAVAGVVPASVGVIRADNPPKEASNLVVDSADQMHRLVMDHKYDDLAKLQIPASPDPQIANLNQWKTDYVSHMATSEKQRQEQYDKLVGKAQDYLKRDRFDDAIVQTVSAYTIAKDQAAFLDLDWVKDVTAKVADQADKFEKQGQWLESLQLYSDLNTLYEIDTRYKPQMQRLARRTRLLALYTPKALLEMRKEITTRLEKLHAQDVAATQPGTQPATQPALDAAATLKEDADEEAAFPKWQDTVEKITPAMLSMALEQACNYWVEQTDYDTLFKGGVDAMRLFLTTPELAKEFPGLTDEAAKAKFAAELDTQMKKLDPANPLTQGQLDDMVDHILTTNAETIKLPEAVAVMEFTDGAMEKLDPFTAVIWPHEVDEFFKNTQGHFGGVGVQISLENGQLKVITPLEDTPAYKAGIMAGDIITAINGKPTAGISIDTAVHSIMGKPDTEVVLRVKREGESQQKEYTLTRAEIRVTSVKGMDRDKDDQTKWNFMIDPDSKIGYIRITGFQEDTAKELKTALEALKDQGVRGVILDLRFNPGGLLDVAVKMCDEFIDHGTIVSTRGRVARPTKRDADHSLVIPTNMPVEVLVNQYSASASEIFSGAMKDLNRGLIVGQRTFGKGSVQNLMQLTPNAAMKLTQAHYYLPNGECLHRIDGAKTWGVEPDVVVPETPVQVVNLVKARRDAEVIHTKITATTPASQPATTAKAAEPVYDTQLDTALLLMRLQLIQQPTGVAAKQ
jgi:carboxyl-terminal processing protease